MSRVHSPSAHTQPGAAEGGSRPVTERDRYLRDNYRVVMASVADLARTGIHLASLNPDYQTESRDLARIGFIEEVCIRWANRIDALMAAEATTASSVGTSAASAPLQSPNPQQEGR